MIDRVVTFLARRRVTLGFVTTVAALVLARPTWTTWQVGLLVALAGEAIRVWAAGHLEKGREVTTSGPYRWTAHPLYVGSSLLALGVVIAARNVPVAGARRDLHGLDHHRGDPDRGGVPAPDLRRRVRPLPAVGWRRRRRGGSAWSAPCGTASTAPWRA